MLLLEKGGCITPSREICVATVAATVVATTAVAAETAVAATASNEFTKIPRGCISNKRPKFYEKLHFFLS